jgi:hypothetical protein
MTTSQQKLDREQPGDMTLPEKPIRVGVFDTAGAAERVIDTLLLRGFSSEEITVFCSTDEQQQHFSAELEPPRTAKSTKANLENAATGSAIGSVLGGLTAVAGLVTLGGLPVLVAGGMAGALTGSVVGGLTGAMLSRGVEKEPADYFDQAVAEGKILVAVETEQTDRLTLAAKIIEDGGAIALPLRQG